MIPELTDAENQRVVDTLMTYNGPDGAGLEMREAVSEKIVTEFGDRIFSHQDTKIDIVVATIPQNASGSSESKDNATYDVEFAVQTHRGQLNYTWMVNVESGKVTSDDQPSKNIVNRVNFD